MEWYFLPRNKYFWILHLSSAAIILMFLLAGISSKDVIYSMLVTGNLSWQIFFLFSGLIFRALTLRYTLHKKSILQLIVIALCYACIAGLLVAALTIATTVPLFWHHFQSARGAQPFLNPQEFIPSQLINLWKLTQLFISAWAFIYISALMNRNVKESELSNLRLQNSLKEAQLNSLSGQLNPHFLFNALNNIRFMMHEDVHAADTMITSMSDILRHSLESNKKEKITLEQEMDIVKKYLALNKIQLDRRLDFELCIPAGIGHCLIPPMLLQILIENAIKHGIDNIQGGGKLRVDITEKDQHLKFSVANDLPKNETPTPKNTGIGLKNIRQRLALLYGEDASVDLLKSNTQFQVVISLPKEFTP